MAEHRRLGAAFVASLLVAGVAPAIALSVSPIDGGPLTLYPVAINTSAGDQYDPHVDGDLVSYTSGDTIRFYSFFSGSDAVVPTEPGAQDQLSDVSLGRIAFSRVGASGVPVLVYDIAMGTTAEIDHQSAPLRFSAAIGAQTVAFIDHLATTEGEVFISTLDGSTVRLTNDAAADRVPQVSPAGDLVVYESCSSDCDVHQAAWTGSDWVIAALAGGPDEDSNPDTDGQYVVYDSTRAGDRDVYWQLAGGSAEQQLGLLGEQRNPSLSHGVIAFETVAPGEAAADLAVYQISTNRVFRITSTPADENLNDISVLADGRVRVAWSSGAEGARDVYGATLELPPVGPAYNFGGFVSPVDSLPTVNLLKAGAAVPVKFSVGGDHGLAIFAPGYPKSQSMACDATAPLDGVEETVSAGGSSLTYDPATGLYAYVWKTDRAWAGACRQLVLKFADGSSARANFKFK